MFFGVERSCCCGGGVVCIECEYTCTDVDGFGEPICDPTDNVTICAVYDINDPTGRAGCPDPETVDIGCDVGLGYECNNVDFAIGGTGGVGQCTECGG